MRRPSVILALLLGFAVTPANAADVSFNVSPDETYVGMPVTVSVTIENATQHDPPEFPKIEGADVRDGGRSDRSFVTVTPRGRVDRTTYVYTYYVSPRKEGILIIPPIVIRADGNSRETAVTKINVRKSETGDLLFVELQGAKKSVYVGEALDVSLEIWLKPFAGNGFNFDHNDMWNRVDVNSSSWGSFAEILNQRDGIKVRRETRPDAAGRSQTYYVYSLPQRVWPDHPGQLDLGAVAVVVRYPLQARRNRFSLIGPPYEITQERPVSAVLADSTIQVKPLPTEGQPDFFRGAVGRYTMKVTAAPTEVSVGDPITLNLVFSGEGRLDQLQAPPLAAQASLTADFKVPDEVLAGTVQNGAKQFTQSIRAKTQDVTAIPPIQFAYFDPQSEQFVTLQGERIPITVKASARMSIAQVTESPTTVGSRTQLTLLDTGLLANYDQVEDLLVPHMLTAGPGVVTLATAPPAAWALCFLVQRRRARLRGDRGLARRRGARRSALSAINALADRNDPAAVASELAAAITRYVADRCNLPPAGLTRGDAVARLRARRVPDEFVQRVDALLADCESVQYAGLPAANAHDFLTRARACVEDLERQKF